MLAPLRRALVALPIFVLLYIVGIASVGLIGPDEPRYAEIGYEMAHEGQWVTPKLLGDPWFEKPALLYWMIGAAYKLGFGDNWAPRIFVALLAIGFLVFYYVWLTREFSAPAAGWATGLLATSIGWLAFGQLGITDLPLAAFFSAAVLLSLRWLRTGERAELPYAGACLGLAVLAKGLVPLVLVAPVLWFGRRRLLDLWVPALTCLLVALPWYWLCTQENGAVFLREFFLKHHFQRFNSDAIQHVQPWWYYIPVGAGLLFPWTPLIALQPWLVWKEDVRAAALLSLVGFGFVFFSAATNKLPSYVLPLLPLWFAVVGLRLAKQNARVLLGVSVALLGVLPFVLQVLPGALDVGLTRTLRGEWSWTPLAWLGGSILAGIAISRWPLPAAVPVGVAAMAMVVFRLSAYSEIDRSVSQRARWQAITCSDSLRRTEVYGIEFYRHYALPECRK